MKYLVIFLILAVVLGGGGWLVLCQDESRRRRQSVVQTTDQVTRRTIEKIVPANGKVASNLDVDIKCQASGTIKTLPYTDVSKEVKPGEMLCQLDPIDMQRQENTAKAVVDADQARLTEAKLNWNIAKMALDTPAAAGRGDAGVRQGQGRRGPRQGGAHPATLRRQTWQARRISIPTKPPPPRRMPMCRPPRPRSPKKPAENRRSTPRSSKSRRWRRPWRRISRVSIPPSRMSTIAPSPPPMADNPTDPPRWFISSLLTNIAPGYIVQSGTSGFSAGTTIMTLSDLSHVFVLASVDESNIGHVIDPVRGGESRKSASPSTPSPGRSSRAKSSASPPRASTSATSSPSRSKLKSPATTARSCGPRYDHCQHHLCGQGRRS